MACAARWQATALAVVLSGCAEPAAPEGTPFVEVARQAGLRHTHALAGASPSQVATFSGGLAVGDYDGDGDLDVYAIGGSAGTNRLFENQGDGRFEEPAYSAAARIRGMPCNGATFADIDGDRDLDLFVGGIEGTKPWLFENRDGELIDRGLEAFQTEFPRGRMYNTWSAAFADYDLDGDLDLFTSRWDERVVVESDGSVHQLWRNDGNWTFTDDSNDAGLTGMLLGRPDYSLTASFVDLDEDLDPDLLIAADFTSSSVLLNEGDGTFADATPGTITDEHGMGMAIGDFDGDGVLDWFVTSIWDPAGSSRGGGWGSPETGSIAGASMGASGTRPRPREFDAATGAGALAPRTSTTTDRSTSSTSTEPTSLRGAVGPPWTSSGETQHGSS